MRHCLLTCIPSASSIPHFRRTLDKAKHCASVARCSLQYAGPRRLQITSAQCRYHGRFEHGRTPSDWSSSILCPSLPHSGSNVTAAQQCRTRCPLTRWNALPAALVWSDWCERGTERADQCCKAVCKQKWRCGGRAWEVLDCGLLFFDVVIPTVAISRCEFPSPMIFCISRDDSLHCHAPVRV
jgi:hypothetical protein